MRAEWATSWGEKAHYALVEGKVVTRSDGCAIKRRGGEERTAHAAARSTPLRPGTPQSPWRAAPGSAACCAAARSQTLRCPRVLTCLHDALHLRHVQQAGAQCVEMHSFGSGPCFLSGESKCCHKLHTSCSRVQAAGFNWQMPGMCTHDRDHATQVSASPILGQM